MTVDFIGSFVFINHGYGSLGSIYHNILEPEPFPETAKRSSDRIPDLPIADLFDGLYKTIWLERGSDDKTDLEIALQPSGSYKLKWYIGQTIYYEGIGFLHNGDLVGSYWKLVRP